jgi:hypothetical protein
MPCCEACAGPNSINETVAVSISFGIGTALITDSIYLGLGVAIVNYVISCK